MQAVTRRLQAQKAERLARGVDPDAVEVARLRHSHDLAELARLAMASDDASWRFLPRQAQASSQ